MFFNFGRSCKNWISLYSKRTVKYLSDSDTGEKGHPFRKYISSCSTMSQTKDVDYDEIIDLCNHPEKLLIDVRNPDEVQKGCIPTSINIPLGELQTELCLNAEVFKQKYCRVKPQADSYLILYCRSGARSQQGVETVRCLGYTNVHNYPGSWLDYEKRSKCD